MTLKRIVKSALTLRGYSVVDVAEKAGTTTRNVEYHLEGKYHSSAVAKTLKKMVGKEISKIRQIVEELDSECVLANNSSRSKRK